MLQRETLSRRRSEPMDNEPIHVLLVEDNPDYALLLKEILDKSTQGQLRLEHAVCFHDAVQVLPREPFDAVLLDLTLPDKRGLATYTDMASRAPHLPVIVLTSIDDEAMALEAMRKGAQDYLVKGQVDGPMIWRVLRYAIERKRLLESLREREEFFRLISENMSDLVAVLDRDGRRLYNSPSYRNLLGDPAQLVGTDSFEEVHPEDRPRVEQIFRETVSTGVGQRAEYRMMCRGGEIRFVESQGSVIRDARNRPGKVVVVSRDITERKLAEQALRESEQRYRRLLDSTTDYIYTVKIVGGQAVATSHGPGCQAVTGYSSAEYESDPFLWYRMVCEEDRPLVIEQARKGIAGEPVTPLDHRIIHKDGSIRWVRSTPVPRKDEQGQVISYDGLVSDITARKLAEEQLRHSEALYQSLVESLPQNIFRKDVDGRFTFVNRRFAAALGKPIEGILGRTDADFFPPDLARKYQDDDRAVIKSGQLFETVEEHRTPDGPMRYVHVVKIPVYDRAGGCLGIQGIFWDITEQRRAEQALERTLADLKKSHEDLKAAQLQLIQAEKMESVGTLAAGVAHEVKNPLQILLMGMGYLANNLGQDQENVRVVLADMNHAVKRADAIIRGLMDFAAPSRLELKEHDLNQVIEQSLGLLKYELMQRSVRVERKLHPNLPSVHVDSNKIKQVLVNLGLNAIQAMPRGGTLTIETYQQRLAGVPQFMGELGTGFFKAGDTVVLVEVRDTGTGIPEDKLTRIFDPFFTTKPPGMGTGLGLTAVKRIIELHGGRIDIRNLPQGGVRALMVFNTTAHPVTGTVGPVEPPGGNAS
jgi:PAS domain S-box-containing protein